MTRKIFVFTFCNIVLGILSVFNLTRMIWQYDGYTTSFNSLLKQTSSYSPILDRIPILLSTVTINGDLFPSIPPPIYQQEPSPEVDDSWKRISGTTGIPLTAAEITLLGQDSQRAAKFPHEWDYNENSGDIIAQIDVFHQIHCLNYIRKEIHFDYYYASTSMTFMRKVHAQHCLYMLLQNIMCEADLDVVTYNWIGEKHLPFQDFGIQKQCRDFEAVLAWQRENEVDGRLYSTIKRPSDVPPLPRPSCVVYDIFNVSAMPEHSLPGCS